MFKYFLKRFAAMLVTLFLILTLSFWVIRLMPLSIFENPDISPEIQQKLEEKMHLHEPMVVQFGYFISGVLTRGDFGTSVKIRPGMDVLEIIWERVPTTMILNAASLILAIPLGILAGTIAALKRGKMTDNLISFLIVIFISVPSFVFASLLQYLFTLQWPVFPTLYLTHASTTGQIVASMVLPVIALSLGPLATIARYLRGELIESLSSEYMLLARTKGLTRGEAVVAHAFRNSLVPIANTIIPLITGIMGGSLVIEKIFAVPGIGGLLVDSIMAGDHFLTVALLMMYSVTSLLTIFIIDVSYGIIDPRIRIGGGQE
jgi:oligopeptide transport system permease protein